MLEFHPEVWVDKLLVDNQLVFHGNKLRTRLDVLLNDVYESLVHFFVILQKLKQVRW